MRKENQQDLKVSKIWKKELDQGSKTVRRESKIAKIKEMDQKLSLNWTGIEKNGPKLIDNESKKRRNWAKIKT